MALTYHNSGVNYDLMDPFKNACIKAGGNSSQLLELSDSYIFSMLEGLGSLNQLADDIYEKTGRDYYYQVGWGNAASILNDLCVTGAVPLDLKLFIAAGNENWFKDEKRWKNLVRGFNDAAQFANVSWNGGETQTLTGVIKAKSIVLAGSATGIIKPKKNLISENNLKVGDRIILLASSGIHTNGVTLVRKLLSKDLKLADAAIRAKTIIYSPFINKLIQEKVELHYVSHITGHGWRKIMRPSKDFNYVIEKVPKAQSVFTTIQKLSGMTIAQMYGDYNMGVGFALYVPEKSVEKILKLAKKMGLVVSDAGFVSKGGRSVVIKPLNIILDGKSLKIR